VNLVAARSGLVHTLCCLLATAAGYAQATDVTAHVQIVQHGRPKPARSGASSGVVVWLVPLSSSSPVVANPGRFRLVQHGKQFNPHLLVVPAGSTVEFPNLDPFFHNVFSLFNGKRFDLGLYEAGSTRTVRFDHEGVSYVFCNIHPEMSAVVVALSTPYFGVSSRDGEVTLHDVPPGTYQMKVWAEGADAAALDALDRQVRVTPSDRNLADIRVAEDAEPTAHKDKFGEDYKPEPPTTY
jgi:hypothetical protein